MEKANKLTPEQVQYVWENITEEQRHWLEQQPFKKHCAIVRGVFLRWHKHVHTRAKYDMFYEMPEIFKHRCIDNDDKDV